MDRRPQHASSGTETLGMVFLTWWRPFRTSALGPRGPIQATFSTNGKETVLTASEACSEPHTLCLCAGPACTLPSGPAPAREVGAAGPSGGAGNVGSPLLGPVQGPCRGVRRPGNSRLWAPCAARPGLAKGDEAPAPGTVFPRAFPSPESSSQADSRGPKCEGGGAQGGEEGSWGPGPTGDLVVSASGS